MADRTERLFILADGDQAIETFGKVGLAGDAAADKLGASGAKAGEKFSAGIESGTSKVGSAFEKLGSSLGNWGLPFAGNLEKIGKDLDNVETKGKGVGEALSLVGGVTVAALVGAGAEAIHISDQFDTAQSNLESAVKNSGNSWDAYKGKIDAAYTSAAKLGFENTDTAEGLQSLVTATQSPTKALQDLGTAENIARLRHESLSDASAQLAKILGGNTRLLQQWGINLDIGSGKLHSIQSAEESVQKAQLNLTTTQAEINDGQKTGAEASGALASAQLSLRNAQRNLSQDQQAIPDILDAINQRTKDVAKNYGETLPGQLKIAQAEVHNLGTAFGGDLEPKLLDLLGDGAKVLSWVMETKPVLDALAVTIGGTLSAAVAVFTYNRLVSLATGLQKIGQSFVSLGTTALEKFGVIDVAAREDAAIQVQTSTTIIESQAAVKDAWTTTQAAIDSIMAEQEAALGTLDASYAGLGEAAAASAAEAEARMATMASDAEIGGAAIEATNAGIGASFTAMLGPIGAVAVAAAAMYEVLKPTKLGAGDIQAQQGAAEIAGMKSGTGGYAKASAAQIASTIKDINAALANDKSPGHLNAQGNLVAPASAGGNQLTATQETVAKSQAQAAVIAEKGLTGLALSAQKAQARLDQVEANPLSTQQQIANAQAAYNIAEAKAATTPGSTIPKLPKTPGVGGTAPGAAPSTALTAAEVALENRANEFNARIKLAAAGGASLSQQGTTIAHLGGALTSGNSATDQKLITGLEATHNATLTKLAGTLESEWASATAKLTTIIDSDTKAGQSMVSSLTNATTSDSLTTLRESVDSIHQTKMNQLVGELDNIHKTAETNLGNQIVADFKAAQAQLAAQLLVQQQVADADSIQLQATQLQGMTTLATDTANKQVQAIEDAATIVSNSFSAAATAITDATQAMNDAAQAQVTSIGDQAQTQADILGERGLYGLNLEAQQAKVALDQMTTGYDQTLAGLQQNLDSAKTAGDQSLATAQGLIGQAAQAQNAIVAAAQQNLDAVTAQQNSLVQQAQAGVDQAAQGTELQQQQAAAALQQAQATAANAEANASSSLAAAQAQASTVNAEAQAALSGAQGNAQVIIAQATQALATAQDQASVAEANQQAIITVLQAEASTEFAGSGLTVNQYGLNPSDAFANADALGWTLRTLKV